VRLNLLAELLQQPASAKTIPKRENGVLIGTSISPGVVNIIGDAVDKVIQAHQVQKRDSIPQSIPEGTIISITIGSVLNLGNYSNVNLEVTATSAEGARTAFQSEITLTVVMMRDVIRQAVVK
jgi:hypothetical protein